jgi:hypothetical protein
VRLNRTSWEERSLSDILSERVELEVRPSFLVLITDLVIATAEATTLSSCLYRSHWIASSPASRQERQVRSRIGLHWVCPSLPFLCCDENAWLILERLFGLAFVEVDRVSPLFWKGARYACIRFAGRGEEKGCIQWIFNETFSSHEAARLQRMSVRKGRPLNVHQIIRLSRGPAKAKEADLEAFHRPADELGVEF